MVKGFRNILSDLIKDSLSAPAAAMFTGSRPFPRECPSSAFSLRGFGERNQVFEP
jgi:hypothetical protein